MEEMYVKGKCKSIGVANFDVAMLKKLIKNSKIKPVVN